MNEKKNNQERPRAVRRPRDISSSAEQNTSRRQASRPASKPEEASRQPSASGRIVSGRHAYRPTQNLAVKREEKKKATSGRELTLRQEQRALIAAKKEADWQNEVERVRGGVDKLMLAIVVVLLALGALMVYSASYPTALNKFGDSFYYLKKHLIFMVIGGVGMLAAIIWPFPKTKKWLPFFVYGVAIVLLLAVLVIGTAEGEAKRWIYFGSFSVQPSEIMKVALVLILAWYIDKYNTKMKERNGRWSTCRDNTLYPISFVVVACGLVLLERHLSGTVIIGAIGIAVMLVGGCHLGYTLLTTLVGGTGAIIVFLLANPYALKRITTFTSDNVDTLGEGWQTTQGILAIGSGGLFGVGLSESRQKFGYVSMAHNDFIYTIWCEELGFIGAILLIGLFLLFLWRGYVIAMRAPDTFSMLTVFGITTQVALQAFLNMMVVCDIIPNTGISLPFFSYGGSSLIMLMVEMGIILSISRQYYRKKSS